MTQLHAVAPAPLPKRFYRPDELAAMFEVSRDTVYRWIARGLIRSVRIGGSMRIPADEMERVLRDGARTEKK
jgi:excisionase family DNA binding protein